MAREGARKSARALSDRGQVYPGIVRLNVINDFNNSRDNDKGGAAGGQPLTQWKDACDAQRAEYLFCCSMKRSKSKGNVHMGASRFSTIKRATSDKKRATRKTNQKTIFS